MLRKFTDVLIPEIKHLDNTYTYQNPMTPTNVMAVNTSIGFYPQQGTDFTNRIGRRVKIIKIQMNCTLTPTPGTLGNSGETVRCDFWLDKECKGSAPNAADVYQDVNMNTIAFQNANFLRRFVHLHQTFHAITPMSVLSSNVTSATAQTAACYEIPIPRGGIEVNFGSNNGTITDCLDNLVFMTMSQNNANPACTMQVVMRYWFTDL
jgi:hypothetical protein